MKNDMSNFDDPRSECERALPGPFSSEVDVDVFATSHKGHVRPENEDHFLVIRVGRNLETVFSNLIANRAGDRFEETAYGMIVADGVGGEAAGEVASDEAIFGLLNLALRTPDWQFRWGPREKNTVMWRMRDRLRVINTALLEQATAQCSSRWNVHDDNGRTELWKGSHYRSHRRLPCLPVARRKTEQTHTRPHPG